MNRKAIAAAMLALTGCGIQSGAIQPGMWETTMTMSAGKSELWRTSSERCVFEEEAANPGSGLFKVGPLNHCTVVRSEFANGRLSVHATCPERQSIQASVPMSPEWLASKIAIRGTYTDASMTGTLDAQLEGTLEAMKFAGTLSARRKGDC